MGRGEGIKQDLLVSASSEGERIIQEEPLAQHKVSLLSVVGSRAYGLAHSGSDTDFRGFYIAPTREVLSLGEPRQQLERKDPDLTVWEVEKFLRLASKANPNVLEILWAPSAVSDEIGDRIKDMRQEFLSEAVRQTYGGYAAGQAKQLQRVEKNRPEKREKFARHLFRLFEQGTQLLETGDMSIRVQNPDQLREWATAPIGEILERFEELDARFQEIKTDLPKTANMRAINDLLLEIRLAHL